MTIIILSIGIYTVFQEKVYQTVTNFNRRGVIYSITWLDYDISDDNLSNTIGIPLISALISHYNLINWFVLGIVHI